MLYDFNWCSCLYVNFDLGVRRGDVIESGEEAKNGAGDDMMCNHGMSVVGFSRVEVALSSIMTNIRSLLSWKWLR